VALTTIPVLDMHRAAQYVRMSTGYQRYSIENQAAVIATYAQPVAAAEKQIARDRIELMKTDKAFVRRLLDGDQQAKSEWTRMHQIISLPPLRPKRRTRLSESC
jgi:hypothetical protein